MHKDPKIVDQTIKKIKNRFGEMTVTRGFKHTFVGIDIELCMDGTVKLVMMDYLKKRSEVFEENISGMSPTPAGIDLFQVDTVSPRSIEECYDVFYYIVAKLLFVSKRARADIYKVVLLY